MPSKIKLRKETKLQQTKRALDLLIDHLDDHINRGIFLLSGLARNGREPEKYQCASLMLLNAGISLVGMKKYYRPINLQSKDIVVLFRVVFEGIVNGLYVLSCEKNVAERALRHAQQKKFRNHNQEIKIGPYITKLTFVGDTPNNLDDLVQEFTSARGRELNWTSRTMRQKISAIADKYGQNIWLTLGVGYHSFYGYSSEYIHSSLFSALDHIGKKSKKAFRRDMETTVFTCVIESGCAVLALLDVLKEESGIKAFEKASKETSEILLSAAESAGAV